MKYVIIATIALMGLIANSTHAQDYKTSIGGRAGFYNGLTIKSFIGEKAALEAIISTRWRGITAVGLYEVHNKAFDEVGFKWFYGGGVHITTWDNYYYNRWDNRGNGTYVAIGIDGIIGLEYTFQDAPINISVDWKPAFHVIGYSHFVGDGGGLSIRYIIK